MKTTFRFWSNLPISVQIIAVYIVGAALVYAGAVAWAVPALRNNLTHDKEYEAQTLVQCAYNTIEYWQKKSAVGEMPVDDAKRQALAILSKMRYGREGYFWANSLDGTMLAHPILPELNGKNLLGLKDSEGVEIFREFIKIANGAGEGFLYYKWVSPVNHRAVPKLSYVKKFAPWGWIVGTGVYLHDIEAAITELKSALVVGLGVLLVLIGAATALITVRLTRPLKSLSRFARDIDEDSLDARAPIEGSRESAELANALNATLEKLSRSLISKEELVAEYRFNRAVLDSLPVEVLIVDSETSTILDANRLACEAAGVSVGQTMNEDIKSDCDLLVYDVSRTGYDGRLSTYEVTRVVLRQDIKHPCCTLYIARDITSRVQAQMELFVKNRALEEALQKLSAMQSALVQNEKMATLGQIAAGVAHEINNPGGYVRSNLSTLEKYLKTLLAWQQALEGAGLSSVQLEQRKYLKIEHISGDALELVVDCLEGMDRISTIVRNLKSFSRIDDAETTEADLNSCLDDTLAIAWNELKYKCKIVKNYGVIPKISCHPQQLNQVFMNLLINAAQAIATEGVITITTQAIEGYVEVEIADDGPGIEPNILESIFEPFVTSKPAGKGTGLGLSISHDIVLRHGGTLSAHNRTEGGAVFLVRIPEKRST